MQPLTKTHTDKLRDASALVSRYLGIEVIEAAIHGSVLRGFNDPNSDTDICFLLNRPVSDYVSMTTSPFFEQPLEERRRRTLQLSSNMSRELGWNVMVSLVDMRSLLRGIMSASSFSLMAYERFSAQNEKIRFLFESVEKKYFKVENLIFRCGEHIKKGIKNYNDIEFIAGMEYKKERNYLGTLWSAHRLLAYLSGDKQHSRTIQELIDSNREQWADELPEGFDNAVIGVIRARTERSPFDMPQGINNAASALLVTFVEKVLKVATLHLREHPYRYPTVNEETAEIIDLYGLLLDLEEERVKERLYVQRAGVESSLCAPA